MNEHSILQRGNTYKLLAACFYEPEKQLFIEEEVCANLAGLLRTSTVPGAEAAERMAESLQTYDQQQLSIDHAALFVGPFELIAAPYGSVWRERQRRVMGNSTMEVKEFYAEAGLAVNVNEPPDHIAIMLEFMYLLCLEEARAASSSDAHAADKYLRLQQQFFLNALSPWIQEFCEAIAKGTENAFYIRLAQALSHFIQSQEKVYTQAVGALL